MDYPPEPLRSEFRHVAAIRGNDFYIPQEASLDFIDRCRELDYLITYLEAFYITERTTQPDMQYNFENYDSEDVLFGPGWEEAKAHIKKHFDQDLYYEIGIEKIGTVPVRGEGS